MEQEVQRDNEKKKEEGLCDNEEPKGEVLNVYLKINCASCILSFQLKNGGRSAAE